MLCVTSLDLVNNVWLLVVVFSEDPHPLVLTSALPRCHCVLFKHNREQRERSRFVGWKDTTAPVRADGVSSLGMGIV